MNNLYYDIKDLSYGRQKKVKTIKIFKTFRFELHNPSAKKVKYLLKTFKQSDLSYYKALAACESDANKMLLLETKTERKEALAELQRKLQAIVKPLPFGSALKASVIAQIKAQVSSYVELTLSGQEATYPTKINLEIDYQYWLEQLIYSTTVEAETLARDELSKVNRSEFRPLTFEKYRESDGFRILKDDKNRLFAFLNLWGADDLRARCIRMNMVDTRDNQPFTKNTSTGLLFPLKCSPTQIQALSDGQAKSAKLIYREGRFFLMISVEFVKELRKTKYVMGIDRGFDELVTYTIRHRDTGEIIQSGSFSGDKLRDHQRKLETAQKNDQKIGRKYIRGWSNYTANLIHHMSNEIVALADKYSCQVVIEDLSNLKNGHHQKRAKFAPKSNFRRMLTRQQYGKIESVLTYKLGMVGLPALKSVHAAYTSTTCPKCGHSEKNNRKTRDVFKCLNPKCAYTNHADIVGATNVAGSYICFERIKKCLKKGKARPVETYYKNWLVNNLIL